MGVIIMIGVGLFILVLSGFSYLILKHYGYKKTGIAVALFFALIVLIPLFTTIFESQLYFKSDAKDDLKIADIVLKDDFEITYSDIFGMPDYYQITKLKISNRDKKRIIEQIVKSDNFKTFNETVGYYNISMYEENDKIIWNYKQKNEYVIETYEKKQGYSPTRFMLNIKDDSNIVDITLTQD